MEPLHAGDKATEADARRGVWARLADSADAVLPAPTRFGTHTFPLGLLQLHWYEVRLATEADLRGLFGDCELGAVPPIGAASSPPGPRSSSRPATTNI